MARTVLTCTLALCVATALANPQALPVRGVHYATYSLATGELTPTAGAERIGDSVWASTTPTGYYHPQMIYEGPGSTTVDWGDIDGPQGVGGFTFSYATEMLLPERLDIVIGFYAEEDGWDSAGRVQLALFNLTDLPTGGDGFNGWTITVDLDAAGTAFTIDGSDLDFDGLVDFGYTHWFTGDDITYPSSTGPILAGDPNIPTSPGIEDVIDAYSDPGLVDGSYVVTFYYGGDPYAQLYMELYDIDPNASAGCPNPGASGKYCDADIDGSDDCIVDLADLAQLLSNYRVTSGATHDMGDLEPPGGDGDVDLGDLAELLSQYRDDCN
jgi:hypothetical protein